MNRTQSKAHAFDAAALIGAVEETRDHLKGRTKVAFKVTRIPASAPEISPKRILNLRSSLSLTQEEFARVLNVPVTTERSWERGLRSPSGAALRLLQIAEARPEVLAAL